MSHRNILMKSFGILVTCSILLAYLFGEKELSWLNIIGSLTNTSNDTDEGLGSVPPQGNSLTFKHINRSGVYTFPSVCIEKGNYSPPGSRSCGNQTMRIVLYNSSRDGHLHLNVGGSANTRWNHWDVVQTQDPLPTASTHTHLHGVVGYFITPTCPGNIHHFWEDEFRMLISVVRASGRLLSGTTNRLHYRCPWDTDPNSYFCSDVRRFKTLLDTLYFDDFNDVYHKSAVNVCFDYGVFGNAYIKTMPREAVDHVMRAFNISYNSCVKNVVTILERTYRKILNTDQLVTVAKEKGFTVQVLKFEKLRLKEQTRVSACTSVLVGVMGAGLQWGMFMKPNTTIIEVSWKNWGSYYQGWMKAYGVKVKAVTTNRTQVNWEEYQNHVLRGTVLSDAERSNRLVLKPRSVADNIWKFADVQLDTDLFRSALPSVYDIYNNETK